MALTQNNRAGTRHNGSFRRSGQKRLQSEVATFVKNCGGLNGIIIQALDAFVVGCKADGTWQLFDFVWPCCGPTWQAALTVLKHPRGAIRLPSVNFTASDYVPTGLNSGFTGDGSSKYLQTLFYPNLLPSQNNGGFVCVYANPTNGNLVNEQASFAQQNWFRLECFTNSGGQVCYTQAGTVAPPQKAQVPYDCVYIAAISGLPSAPGNAVLYKNGINLVTASASSTGAAPGYQSFLFCSNGASSGSYTTLDPVQYAPVTISFACSGAYPTATQALMITNRIQKFLNILGRLPSSRLNRAYLGFGLTGQSLACGQVALPAYTVRNNNYNRTGTTGPFPYLSSLPSDINFPIVPLAENGVDSDTYGETVCSGCSNALTAVTGQNFFATGCPDSGQAYSVIGPGTAPYNNLIQMHRTANNAILADGGAYNVPAVLIVHGEADATNTSYASNLATWQTAFTTSFQAMTGQANEVITIISQCQSWCSTSQGSNVVTQPSDLQMLTAYLANPTLTVLACPKYILTHDVTDGVHLLPSYMETWLGEYYAEAFHVTHNLQQTFKPLYPLSVTRSGVTITAVMSRGGLEFDTSLVSDPGGSYTSQTYSTNGTGTTTALSQYLGFEFCDDNGGSPSQTIVAINGQSVSAPATTGQITAINANFSTTNITNDTITFTLSGTPTSTNKCLRAAYTATAGAVAGPLTGNRCCLRDSYVPYIASLNSFIRYNYCLSFQYLTG